MSLASKNRRSKKEVMELDITSLLDILVILLVFLLKAYNSSDLEVHLQKKISMVNSSEKQITELADVIQINENLEVYHSDILLGGFDESLPIIAKKIQEIEVKEDGVKKVNLVFDKKIKYKFVKKMMSLLKSNGVSEINLLVTLKS